MKKYKASEIFFYIVLMFTIIDCYIFVRLTNLDKQPEIIKGVLLALGLAVLAYIALCRYRGNLTEKKLLMSILLYGMALRTGYMLYTGCTVRRHDLGEISTAGYGHAAYLLKLIQEGSLPDSNLVQFYQQPFFYLIGSAVSRMVNGLLGETDPYYLVDAAKLVSCFASCMTLLYSEKLCRLIGLKGRGYLLSIALLAFFPAFYLTGGRVNCDAWNTLFFLLAFYYTCRFFQQQRWKYILLLAFIYGFGMMNKISLALMAVFTAVVFLNLLWRAREPKQLRRQLLQYTVFGFISLPLGMWYSIRNARLFGQSITYVLDLASVPEIYCGNYSLVQRFVSWDIKNLFSTPYADPWSDYNYPVYQIKTALFGEFRYEIADWIPVILLFSAICLVCLTIAAIVHILHDWKHMGFAAWAAGCFLFIYGNGMLFAYRYPYGCGMDFRYTVILGVFAAVLLGKYYEEKKEHRIQKVLPAVSAVFCVFSCMMYLFIQ